MAVALSGSIVLAGSITGSLLGTASYSSNTEFFDGLDSSVFALTSSLGSFTSSLNDFSSSINTYTASNNANIAALNAATASLYNATASLYLTTASLNQYTASLNTRSASFACIDSTNNFACAQYFSNASNAISFSSTGSLYSDGGMRLTKDLYVSGTSYFNNVTVFGTQSINYITSSQLNIASNLITVNTATPSVRFGGLAVYDSGSLGTGLTGSILWDSENNHWVYSNPSGSSYSGGMFISGPRSAALGSEVGTTNNALMKGQGGDHITSSMVFEVSGSVGVGTSSPSAKLDVAGNITLTNASNPSFTFCSSDSAIINRTGTNSGLYFQKAGSTQLVIDTNSNVGIGTTTPLYILHTSAEGAAGQIMADQYGTVGSNILLRSARGTSASPTATQAGDLLGSIGSRGYDGSAFSGGGRAGVYMYAGENFTSTNQGTFLIIGTTALGAASRTERIRVTTEGNVGIATTSPSSFLHLGTYASSGKYIDSATLPTAPSNYLITLTPPSTTNYYGGGIAWSEGTCVAAAINAYDDGATGALGLSISTGTNNGLSERVRITSAGISCFACQVCAPQLYACVSSAAAITIDGYSKLSFADRGTEYGTINASRYNFGGESTLMTFQSSKCFLFLSGLNCLMFINTANSNVGIGNTSPLTKLVVNNTIAGAILPYIQGTGLSYNNEGISVAGSNTNNTNIGNGLTLYNNVASVGAYGPVVAWSSMTVGGAYNSTYAFVTGVYGGAGGDNNWAIGDLILGTAESYGATERMRIRNNGNVGINNSSPSYRLDICTAQSIRVVGSSTGYTQGSIIFQSSTTDTPEARGLGVYAFNEGTDATWFYGTAYNAADSFVVNRKAGTTYQDSAASVGEASTFLSINNTGRVGLGTTNVSTEANLFLGAQGTIEGGQLVLQKGTSCSCATHLDNYQDSFRVLVGTDTSSNGVHMLIDHKTRNTCLYGTLILNPATISNSTNTFGTAVQGGYQFYQGTLTNGQQFGSTGGTYSTGFYFITWFDGASVRGYAIYATVQPAANAGTVLISSGGGSYAVSATYNASNAISLAFNASGRGPILTNNTGVGLTFYSYVFGGV